MSPRQSRQPRYDHRSTTLPLHRPRLQLYLDAEHGNDMGTHDGIHHVQCCLLLNNRCSMAAVRDVIYPVQLSDLAVGFSRLTSVCCTRRRLGSPLWFHPSCSLCRTVAFAGRRLRSFMLEPHLA